MSAVSADVEMVRPALGDGGVYGVEGAGVPGKLQWRVGAAAQYERAPVLVITDGEVTSRPVSDRVGGWAGVSLGLGRGVAVQAFVPGAWQTGDDPDFSAEGGGLADPRLGARWAFLDAGFASATLRVDTFLPIGRREAWLGEETFRGAAGVSGALEGGFGAVLLDVGLVARSLEEPAPRFDWGPTAELALGVRADLGDRLSANAAWVGRSVLAGLDARDGEIASEALAGVSYALRPDLRLATGGGAGVQGGVGAATFRGFLTATWSLETKPRERVAPVVVEAPRPPPDAQALVVEEIKGIEVPPPPPPPLVEVVGDEIVFREEIGFALGSAELLPESKHVLAAIADLLASDGRIAHLAIEGHASEEGGLAYNWDLSDRRARACWEALILEGVDPQRMSWRGLGEVAPTGADAKDRRVVFRIARRLAQGEALAAVAPGTLLPWNGESSPLDPVSIPAPKVKEAPEGVVDPNAFKLDEEEE
ncbi:MAG: OmpA family protein [Myxococcota bacterium]